MLKDLHVIHTEMEVQICEESEICFPSDLSINLFPRLPKARVYLKSRLQVDHTGHSRVSSTRT